MILQEEFMKNGYVDLLVENCASDYGIKFDDIFDQEHRPEELLSIFISKSKDDLFFLLNGDSQDIKQLCKYWDNRIRVFIIINEQATAIKKLQYNIVQLIVYSGDLPDKSEEVNLLISRKLIIKGDMTNKNQIEIDDEGISLPFYMLPLDAFVSDERLTQQLKQLLPKDPDVLSIMEKKNPKVRKIEDSNGILAKSFSDQNYEKIKEWLKRC